MKKYGIRFLMFIREKYETHSHYIHLLIFYFLFKHVGSRLIKVNPQRAVRLDKYDLR